ncbi:MAG: hypothetical protein WJU30_00521 [Candidatus Phytoplasma pruni]
MSLLAFLKTWLTDFSTDSLARRLDLLLMFTVFYIILKGYKFFFMICKTIYLLIKKIVIGIKNFYVSHFFVSSRIQKLNQRKKAIDTKINKLILRQAAKKAKSKPYLEQSKQHIFKEDKIQQLKKDILALKNNTYLSEKDKEMQIQNLYQEIAILNNEKEG